MRKTVVGLLSVSLASGLGITLGPAAFASPPANPPVTAQKSRPAPVDDLPNPAEAKRRELREQGLADVLSGRAKAVVKNGSTVVKVGETEVAATSRNGRKASQVRRKDQYVELRREKTDKIFVILAEFGNERHPSYPDRDTDTTTPGPARFDGPLHNEIPEPDRTQNNRTIWQADYNRAHYENLYFATGRGVESLKTYYEKQSSGRYTVDGQVTDWVKVRYNEARYGRSNGYPCASNVCSNTWFLIQDAVNQWVADQVAAGRTQAQIAADLASYDTWDRYDYDGDGNFNEPDGYIDHFQIVHAGGDQADGDPWQGEDAIWSHRWKVFQGTGEGPANNPDGGAQIGTTGLWVADYTIQPENGGLSVFAHEYGHDLGLPDDYDTATGGATPVEWWSLMAQSRLSARNDQGIGTRAGDLGAWQKLQLGWLDYEIAVTGQNRTLTLGPEEYNSRRPQALVVVLPKKQVMSDLPEPFAGEYEWWSGTGDDYEATLTRQVTIPAAPARLTFQAQWDIEDCGADPCDYAYVEVDAGTGFTAIPGSITKSGEGNGIEGTSDGWVPATFDLSAYAGKTISLRFRYATDGATHGQGLFVDNITLTSGGTTVFTDGAESADSGWTAVGFIRTVGPELIAYDNYYIAGWRTYVSYDRYLRTGPYNQGWANTRPNWFEHFPYQQGLLVSYWDTSQADNNVSQHPGEGRNLYIDAHPETLYRLDGQPWRTRIQLYDAPFSRWRPDSFTLHVNGQASYIRGGPPRPTFDDTRNYFDPNLLDHGVKVRNAGVRITVLAQHGTSARVRFTS